MTGPLNGRSLGCLGLLLAMRNRLREHGCGQRGRLNGCAIGNRFALLQAARGFLATALDCEKPAAMEKEELARWAVGTEADAPVGRAARPSGLFLVYMVNNCPRHCRLKWGWGSRSGQKLKCHSTFKD